MALLKVIQLLEINFWSLLILLLQEKGPLMKIVHWLRQVMQTKSGYLTVLIFVWSGIGFVFGLVLGRIIWMLQLL
jgi:hypothetical protein